MEEERERSKYFHRPASKTPFNSFDNLKYINTHVRSFIHVHVYNGVSLEGR